MDTITVNFSELLDLLKSLSKKNPRYVTFTLLEPDPSDPDDAGALSISAHVVTGDPHSIEDSIDAVPSSEFDSTEFFFGSGTFSTNI